MKKNINDGKSSCDNSNHQEVENMKISEHVLIEQYKVAIDLYKHEDGLTWNKVHYFLIVTGVIFALGNWLPVCDDTIRVITGASGFVVSILFLITIFNGFTYLNERKKVAANIEKKLLKSGLKEHLIFGNVKTLFGFTTKVAVTIFVILVAIAWGVTFIMAVL